MCSLHFWKSTSFELLSGEEGGALGRLYWFSYYMKNPRRIQMIYKSRCSASSQATSQLKGRLEETKIAFAGELVPSFGHIPGEIPLPIGLKKRQKSNFDHATPSKHVLVRCLGSHTGWCILRAKMYLVGPSTCPQTSATRLLHSTTLRRLLERFDWKNLSNCCVRANRLKFRKT